MLSKKESEENVWSHSLSIRVAIKRIKHRKTLGEMDEKENVSQVYSLCLQERKLIRTIRTRQKNRMSFQRWRRNN
jgi:hypothetical protein